MPEFEEQCAGDVLQSAISVEVGHRDPCGSKDARIIDVLESTETPENSHPGIKASLLKKVSQLKCIYNNACNMGNKQKELETIVPLENYDIAALTET